MFKFKLYFFFNVLENRFSIFSFPLKIFNFNKKFVISIKSKITILIDYSLNKIGLYLINNVFN